MNPETDTPIIDSLVAEATTLAETGTVEASIEPTEAPPVETPAETPATPEEAPPAEANAEAPPSPEAPAEVVVAARTGRPRKADVEALEKLEVGQTLVYVHQREGQQMKTKFHSWIAIQRQRFGKNYKAKKIEGGEDMWEITVSEVPVKRREKKPKPAPVEVPAVDPTSFDNQNLVVQEGIPSTDNAIVAADVPAVPAEAAPEAAPVVDTETANTCSESVAAEEPVAAEAPPNPVEA